MYNYEEYYLNKFKTKFYGYEKDIMNESVQC